GGGLGAVAHLAVVDRAYVAQPLLLVGHDAAVEAGVAVDCALDGGARLAVVGVAVDLDPELARVDVDDLVARDGAADVAAHVLDAGHGAQLAAGPLHDAAHPPGAGP